MREKPRGAQLEKKASIPQGYKLFGGRRRERDQRLVHSGDVDPILYSVFLMVGAGG